jgi:hypothetical protein
LISLSFIYDILFPLIVSELLKDDFSAFATEFSKLLSINGISLRDEKKNDAMNRYKAFNKPNTDIILPVNAENAFGAMIDITTVQKRFNCDVQCIKPVRAPVLKKYCRNNC